LTPAELSAALQAGVAGIVQRGRAAVGDKTMVDAWTPALAALAEALGRGEDLAAALRACADAAEAGMNSTVPLVAKKGRASYLGERSAGHMDPGAASTTLLVHALYKAVDSENTSS
jgi:dihydroxyacetone kinase-like protein